MFKRRQETGLAFTAGDLDALDGEATLRAIREVETETLVAAPIQFEDIDGNLINYRLKPIDAGDIGVLLNRSKEPFHKTASSWFIKCCINGYPVFLKEVEVREIKISPDQQHVA